MADIVSSIQRLAVVSAKQCSRRKTIAATLLAERLPLTAFIASVTRDFHLAEDVFQEVCVKAVARAETFEMTAHVMMGSAHRKKSCHRYSPCS